MAAAIAFSAASLVVVITWLILAGPPEPRRLKSEVVVTLGPPIATGHKAKPVKVKLLAPPAPVPAPEAAPKAPPAPLPAAKDARPGDTPKTTEPSEKSAEKTAAETGAESAAKIVPKIAAKIAAKIPKAPPPIPAQAPVPARQPPVIAKITLPAATAVTLPAAPDPALVEETDLGLLPRRSADGRKPWQVYARPFDATNKLPRIAIIINNLGLSGAATEAAIQRLPGTITLAFAPYSKRLEQWINLARAAGHEVLLDLPMEPIRYPAQTRRSHMLLTSLNADQNLSRLHWTLGRVTGYVGVINQMGSRFTTSKPHILPILMELERRGLLFVDSRSALGSIAARVAAEVGLPRAANSRFIDSNASRDAIDARLASLEKIAREKGFAVGIGAPFPVTIDRLVLWARGLDNKKILLAPISAVVDSRRK